MSTTPEATLRAAQQYLAKGWGVVPIPRGKKAPTIKDWPKLRLTEADLPLHFSNGSNIGLLLGEPSGGLVDLDLDVPEAIAAAPKFLPKTGMIHGRKSKPRSHRRFIADPLPQTTRWQDPDGTVLCELRSSGSQTVVPPSVHTSGEPYEWDVFDQPLRLDGRALHMVCDVIAACAMLARHWPKQSGNRNKLALALAGMLLQGGLKENAVRIVHITADLAHDDELSDRVRAARSTVKRLAENKPITGARVVADILSEPAVACLKKWLDLKDTAGQPASAPYRVEAGRIVAHKMTRDGLVTIPLCNFSARVTEEVSLDDGVETTRAFILEGQLESGKVLPAVRVPAARFNGMNWVSESWGLSAVVRAGFAMRDQLREAIQRLSPNARQRRVFTHTGWREIDGVWLFLTASGAVGHDGFEVDIGTELTRYRLPGTAEDPVEAMRVSLRLLNVAPLSVTGPLWSAIFRAPLASAHPVDLSIWVEGVTGSLKSTLAAVFLSHYGDFGRTNLPGAWSSTANQLERRAFVLKDTVFVVDDYAPSGLDAREMETKATRLLRGQGNLAGRGRLRSDLTERPSYPPRGLIISTGEQHPPGQSILARMLLLDLERSAINLAALSEAQQQTARLPHAMSGYIAWLAPQMPHLPKLLRDEFEDTRHKATVNDEHLRVPESLAHLWLGFCWGLKYAEAIGACSPAEANNHCTRYWEALLALGRTQGAVVGAERPTLIFLRVLLTLVMQKRALLHPKDWVGELTGSVPLVGWLDAESIYLIPEAAFQAVVRFCRDSGENFPIRKERLRRDLGLEGLSECDPGRHTTTTSVDGRSHRVIQLRRPVVEKLLGEQFPDHHR